MTQVILAVIVLYILLSISFRFDGRFAIATAFCLLIVTAYSSVKGNNEIADQLAIYMYYFLAAGIIVILINNTKLVPESWPKRSHIFMTSNLGAATSYLSVMISNSFDKMKYGNMHNEASIMARRLEVFERGNMDLKDNTLLIKAKAIQDELRLKTSIVSITDKKMNRHQETLTVLDTSVVLAWLIQGRFTNSALGIRQNIMERKFRAIIPGIVISEVVTSMRAYPHIDENDISAAIDSLKALSLVVELSPTILAKTAANLATRYKITLNDAFKIELAREIGANFITCDIELYRRIKDLQFVKLIGNIDDPQTTEDK